MSATRIALLRGINVGGKNKLPMKDLKRLFEDTGCTQVRTYIQSGNVLFTADHRLAARVPATIEAAIRDRFGYSVPVIIRTADELAAVVANSPYADLDTDDRFSSVAFLADEPTVEQQALLEPDRFTPDVFVIAGREIYLRYPNGQARSKLTNAYFDRRLETVCTVRNWRTTKKLLEMSAGR